VLCARAAAAGFDVVASRRDHLDVTSPDSVAAAFAAVRPAAVVHAVGVLGNSPSGSPADNWAVNARGAAHVAAACARTGARLVHVSSDAVHSGRPEPYTEADDPSPVHPYGAAKAAGELAVAVLAPTAAIVRTSLIVSGGRGPLSKYERFALALARGEAEGVLFTDEVRCPVAVDDLASALVELVSSDFAGVINIAGPQPLTRYELGVLVARANGADPARLPAGTIAGSGLSRPGHLRLDCTLAGEVLARPPRALDTPR
jgi:dTDP-4-dehydrorhamnose reductase